MNVPHQPVKNIDVTVYTDIYIFKVLTLTEILVKVLHISNEDVFVAFKVLGTFFAFITDMDYDGVEAWSNSTDRWNCGLLLYILIIILMLIFISIRLIHFFGWSLLRERILVFSMEIIWLLNFRWRCGRRDDILAVCWELLFWKTVPYYGSLLLLLWWLDISLRTRSIWISLCWQDVSCISEYVTFTL